MVQGYLFVTSDPGACTRQITRKIPGYPRGAPLSFLAGGSLLVSGSRVIQADSGEVLAEVAVEGVVRSIGVDSEGYRLILATDQGIEAWQAGGD